MAEYIDRESLYKKMEGRYKYSSGKARDAYRIAIDDILDEPSAEVALVRHGRWVQVIVHEFYEDGHVDRIKECCSSCHEPNGRRLSNYCPNCGAKMDGGETDA